MLAFCHTFHGLSWFSNNPRRQVHYCYCLTLRKLRGVILTCTFQSPALSGGFVSPLPFPQSLGPAMYSCKKMENREQEAREGRCCGPWWVEWDSDRGIQGCDGNEGGEYSEVRWWLIHVCEHGVCMCAQVLVCGKSKLNSVWPVSGVLTQ